MKTARTFGLIISSFALILTTTLFLSLADPTRAAEIRLSRGEDVVIDDLVDDDLYVTGNSIIINEDVNGDLFAFGNKVTINDDVYGDAFIVAGSIIVNEDIRGNLYCGGGFVTIEGNISEDATIVGGNITLNGDVEDDVRIVAGRANVSSVEIGGDLIVQSSTGKVSSSTSVNGEETINISQSVKDLPLNFSQRLFGFSQFNITRMIFTFLRNIGILIGWLVIGLLLFKFVPKKSRKIADILSDRQLSAKSFLYGGCFLLSLVILVPILLIFSIIGIGQPLLAVFILILGLILSVAGIYGATGITKMIVASIKKSKYDRHVLPMLLGVCIYHLIGLFSFLCCMNCFSFIIKLIVTTYGLGGILMTLLNLKAKRRKR